MKRFLFMALTALGLAACCQQNDDVVAYKIYDVYNGTCVPDFSTMGEPDRTGFTNDFSLIGIDGAIHDHFAAQLEGPIVLDETGEYEFYFVSDDGGILYVDDSLVVNHDGKHGISAKCGKMFLKKGRHNVRIDYFNYDKALKIELLYSCDGGPMRRRFSLGDGIPAFVRPEGEETAARYKDWKGADETIVFPILTDVHSACRETYKHIGYVASLDDLFNFDFMVNLGDIGLNDPITGRSKEAASEMVDKTRNQMALYDGVFLYAAGNHDWDAGEGTMYNSAQLSEWFQAPSLEKAGGNLNLVPGKCYCWYDIPAKNTRFIILNSEGTDHVGVTYIYDNEQLCWLKGLLDGTPSEMNVVVMSHYCPQECGRWIVSGLAPCAGSVELMSILSEYKANGGKLLAVLCGDSHANACETEGGVPYFISQGLGGDMGIDGMQPDRQKRAWFNYTKTLCCDVIAIKPATGEVRSFRIGAGGKDMDYIIFQN